CMSTRVRTGRRRRRFFRSGNACRWRAWSGRTQRRIPRHRDRGFLLAIKLTLPVNSPATDGPRHQNQSDQYGDHGQGRSAPGACLFAAGSLESAGGVLLGNRMAARRRFLRGLQIAGDGLLLINADVLRIGANIALVEDTAGEEIELFLFQGAEQASPNLGGGGDFVEGDVPHLARATQPFAECNHLRLSLFQRLIHLKLSSSRADHRKWRRQCQTGWQSLRGSACPAGNQATKLCCPVKYLVGGRVWVEPGPFGQGPPGPDSLLPRADGICRRFLHVASSHRP